LGQSVALAHRGALQAFLAARLDGRYHLRYQCAWFARFQEQAPVEKQRRITRVLAAGALGDTLDLAAALQEARGGPLQLGADFSF
jgi:hypothetical protein